MVRNAAPTRGRCGLPIRRHAPKPHPAAKPLSQGKSRAASLHANSARTQALAGVTMRRRSGAAAGADGDSSSGAASTRTPTWRPWSAAWAAPSGCRQAWFCPCRRAGGRRPSNWQLIDCCREVGWPCGLSRLLRRHCTFGGWRHPPRCGFIDQAQQLVQGHGGVGGAGTWAGWLRPRTVPSWGGLR